MNKPRILMVSSNRVHPPNVGGHQRSNLIYRAMAEVAEVDLLLIGDPESIPSEDMPMLQEKFGLKGVVQVAGRGTVGGWRLIRGLSPNAVDRLAHHVGSKWDDYGWNPAIGPRVEALIKERGYSLGMARQMLPFGRSGLYRYKSTIVDVDDLDTEVYRSRSKAPGTNGLLRPILRWNAGRIDRVIRHRGVEADGIWLCKESDRLQPEYAKARILPNIPFTTDGILPEVAAENLGSKEIVCIATWSHVPNILGMDDFLKRSWPRIRAAVPDAVLRLIGSRMADAEKKRWSAIEGVDVVGFVDSLYETYARCAFSVAPILSGGGTNIKIVESLSFGRTCVITQFARRGYEDTLRHGQELWISDGDDLTDGCIELLKNPTKRVSMSAAGRLAVEQHFSFRAFAKVIHATIEEVLSKSGGRLERKA